MAAHYKLYSEAALLTAVLEVGKGMSINQAACDFEIPFETLRTAVKRGVRVRQEVDRGGGVHHVPSLDEKADDARRTLIMAEELQLVAHIIKCSRHGLAISRKGAGGVVMDTLEKQTREREWIPKWLLAGRPSKKWWRGFMKRHPQLSTTLSDPQDEKRRGVTKGALDSLYTKLKQLIACREDLTRRGFDPAFLWNLDEANIRLDTKKHILQEKGSGCNKSMGSDCRDTFSVLPCISASCYSLPALLVLKGENSERLPHWWGPLHAKL